MSKMLVLASIAGAYGLWYWYCVREERKTKDEEAKLDLQRRTLGIKPGLGKYSLSRSSGSTARRRCPRRVCTVPGASCPRECVEEPQVIRHGDGRRSHKYENVEVCFGPDGKTRELKVDDRNWL